MLDITIIQIIDPGNFLARVNPQGSADQEARAFAELSKKINEHFDNEQIIAAIPHAPSQGEVCIGRGSTDKKWHRLRILQVLCTGKGPQAQCVNLDTGQRELIQVQWLRQAPSRFLELPYQVKTFALFGVRALTIGFTEMIQAEYRSSEKWDTSSVEFMQKAVKDARSCKAEVRSSDTMGTYHVLLFLEKHSGDFVCLNDELVQLRYAETHIPGKENVDPECRPSDMSPLKPVVRKQRTIDEYRAERERKRNMLKARECVSDTEGAASRYDTVQSTKDVLHPQMQVEGYMTDEPTVKIVHRRSKGSPSRLTKSEVKCSRTKVESSVDRLTSAKCVTRTEYDSDPSFTRHKVGESLPGDNDKSSGAGGGGSFSMINQSESQSVTSQNLLTLSTLSPSFNPKRSPLQMGPLERLRKSLSSNSSPSASVRSSPYSSDRESNSSQSVGVKRHQYLSDSERTLSDGKMISSGYQGSGETKPSYVSDSERLLVSNKPHSMAHGAKPYASDINMSDYETKAPSSASNHPIKPSQGPLSPGSTSSLFDYPEAVARPPRSMPTKVHRSFPSDMSLNENMPTQTPHFPSNISSSDNVPIRTRRSFPSDMSSVDSSLPTQTSALCSNIQEQRSLQTSALLTKLHSSPVKDQTSPRQSDLIQSRQTSSDRPHISSGSISGEERRSDRPSGGGEVNMLDYIVGNSDVVRSRVPMEKADTGPCRPPREASAVDFSAKREKFDVTASGEKSSVPRTAALDRILSLKSPKTVSHVDLQSDLDTGLTTNNSDEQRTKVMGKFAGQKLLEKLSGGGNSTSVSKAEKPLVKSTKAVMLCEEDNVLVHGIMPLKKPCYNFADAKLSVEVKEVIEKYRDLISPTLIQAYCWPPIFRGRHLIGIAPSETGKTLAYLAPLVSYLCEPSVYNEVPEGNGPYIIILVLSWKKAQAVFHACIKLAESVRKVRVLQVHGGDMEEKLSFQLINGCEILVTTAPCLTRLLDHRYTDLQRLCHLVVDDADQLLIDFQDEMQKIMQSYTLVLNDRKHCSEAPRQILVFSSQWNMALECFMKVLAEPLLVITSPYEASVYGRVKQIPHMVKSEQRVHELLGLLQMMDLQKNKTIVFTSSNEDIHKLREVLASQSIFCLIVPPTMELYQVAQVKEEWNDELKLLICCDEHIVYMQIMDATTVIHYDMPATKTRFANRLSCMRKYYFDFTEKEEREITPTSHLLISENCGMQLKSIVQLLRRSRAEIPPYLRAMSAGMIQGKEEDEERELCVNLKAFGFCRNKSHCKARHMIIPEVDCPAASDWLPSEGEVRVRETHIVDATHYFVRLLSHRPPKGPLRDFSMDYLKLQMNLSQWFSNLSHRKRHTAPCPGEICGYQEGDSFYRVQIVDLQEMNRAGCTIEAEVKFVDIGRESDIPAQKLFELPPHLLEIPFQAIEVFVCKVKPVDKDEDWTPKASTYLFDILKDKTMDGKIVLRVGNTMWLHPLVERLNLGTSRSISNHMYVHSELLRNGFAEDNPNHMEKLYKLCKGKIDIPKSLLRKSKLSPSEIVETEILPEMTAHHEVYLCEADTPDLIFVQRKEGIQGLEELMEEIDDFCKCEDFVQRQEDLKVGSLCLVKYPNNNKWHRCQILEVTEETFEVFYCDYGDKGTVTRDQIAQIPQGMFQDLSLQAIECRMAHIQPTGKGTWDEEAGDCLWDLTHYVSADMKKLVAKVVSKERPRFAGCHRYVIELVDESSEDHINLAKELVYKGLAVPHEDWEVQDLFEMPPAIKRSVYSSPYQKISDLCAAIYWEQDNSKACQMGRELNTVLSFLGPSCVENAIVKKGLASVVKLMCYVRWANTSGIILDCLLTAARAQDSFCEDLVSAGCVKRLVRCLEQNSEKKIQHQAADVISKLANISPRLKSCLEEEMVLEVLSELFESTTSEQVKGAVCRAFSSLCTGSDRVCHYVLSSSLCPCLVSCLNQSSEPTVAEAVITLLHTLASHDSSHSELKKESLIEAVVKNLSKTCKDKCIQESVQLCDNFSALRRKNKTFLLELQMVPTLSRILQGELTQSTRQLCKDLLSSLVVKVPSVPMAGAVLLPEPQVRTSSPTHGAPPPVCWAQNSFVVMLTVKIQGVHGNPTRIEENRIIFQCMVDCVNYFFNYELFGKIAPNKSHVKVKTSEVLISLRKVEKGRWSRLLHHKTKPSNLTVDFERFVDSSSDSEVCDDDKPFLLKQAKKKSGLPRKDPKSSPKTKPVEGVAAGYDSDSSGSIEAFDDDYKGDFLD